MIPSSSQNRADRITANQTKMVQKRIDTIQKKLYNKESLTRLEKKFAIENSISFPVAP